ncbi:hypothetical protein Pelo_13187 [Pelomyxa schiedti]|nr:hypothetical protein Pelo_13187 [Pelomyxa schiedti]
MDDRRQQQENPHDDSYPLQPTSLDNPQQQRRHNPQFDHLLVRFSDSFGSPTRVQFILIDLAQTKSSGKLVAVASAVASPTSMKGTSLDYLECDDFLTNDCVACSTKSGAIKFVTMSEVGDLISIDDATGKVNPIGHKRYKMLRFPEVVSQLRMSQFCVFEGSYGYNVWDINDPAKPVRECKLQPGFTTTESFADGGFMFQMSESHKEIHVSEECSGDHVITFKLFRPLCRTTRHFSFLPHFD